MTHLRSGLLREALGIGVAVGAFGLSYGAIATAVGFPVLQTCALSVLMFTGASQFALVGVVGAGGSALAGAMTALLLGSRNALYGLRLSSLLHLDGPRRAVAAQFVIDESAAMALARGRRGSGRPAWRSSRAGTRGRSRAPSAAPPSPTPARSASTPPRRRRSWRL